MHFTGAYTILCLFPMFAYVCDPCMYWVDELSLLNPYVPPETRTSSELLETVFMMA